MSDGSPLAILRLWARATADMIDVADRFWKGVINLNPAERDTDTAVGEASVGVRPLTAATRLGTSAFVDGEGVEMAVQEVVLDPVEAGPTNGPIEVKVRVTAAGACRGRYTASIVDDAGNQLSDRFGVFMAQCGPTPPS